MASRRRKAISLETKVEILNEVEKGIKSKAELAS
jgi:hypothetical protein